MNVKLQNKIVQMSKFTLFGLFLQCMLFSVILANDGYGQESELKDIHVSFNLENATIEDAFVEIESLTTFKFAYKKSAIKKRTKISNNFEDQPLDEILLSLAQEGEISFKRINQTIYVTKTKKGETQGLNVESVFQERTITGKVTSVEDEGGMPGVNVLVKGTAIGSITDVNGQYSLEVPDNSIIVFSSVGYVPQEIEVGNQSIIDIVLEVDVTALEEIVVVGYGTQKKTNLTG
ncbi:MAG: carboxypeptidase-like regulatory domain-containing protein, partial [Cyclobacteriaceae bacterium]|nr:carboxypeptidase-like regulatory domain-containing protein [Cyclobacteriaceae bacterium]